MIDLWVHPPFRKKGESFSTRLTLVDHLDNRHRTGRLTIPSDWRPKREHPKPTEEIMHSISDPLVKQIVAILKDEVNRYKECGRPVGGLGSVQVTYKNRTLKGIRYQKRECDLPRRQSIVPDPEKASIHSDNLAALMRIFEGQNQAGKRRIIEALLHRITPGSEYTVIGYFFLLALFRMRQLPVALQTVKDRLISDGKFGFDDAVRMLSGLLHTSIRGSMILCWMRRAFHGWGRPICPSHQGKRCCCARGKAYGQRDRGEPDRSFGTNLRIRFSNSQEFRI